MGSQVLSGFEFLEVVVGLGARFSPKKSATAARGRRFTYLCALGAYNLVAVTYCPVAMQTLMATYG